MKRLLLLVIMGGIMLALVVGCDEDKVTESNLIIGDTSSANFQFIED